MSRVHLAGTRSHTPVHLRAARSSRLPSRLMTSRLPSRLMPSRLPSCLPSCLPSPVDAHAHRPCQRVGGRLDPVRREAGLADLVREGPRHDATPTKAWGMPLPWFRQLHHVYGRPLSTRSEAMTGDLDLSTTHPLCVGRRVGRRVAPDVAGTPLPARVNVVERLAARVCAHTWKASDACVYAPLHRYTWTATWFDTAGPWQRGKVTPKWGWSSWFHRPHQHVHPPHAVPSGACVAGKPPESTRPLLTCVERASG